MGRLRHAAALTVESMMKGFARISAHICWWDNMTTNSSFSVLLPPGHRQLLACLQMQTAARVLSPWWSSDYFVCCPSPGTATVSVSSPGPLRGSNSAVNGGVTITLLNATIKIHRINICLEIWLCFKRPRVQPKRKTLPRITGGSGFGSNRNPQCWS